MGNSANTLTAAGASNPYIDLMLTRYGDRVGFISSKANQRQIKTWNRILEWSNGSLSQ